MTTTSAFSGDTASPGHVDVLIVGAGLSGIGAACHLQRRCPRRYLRHRRGAGRQRRHMGLVQVSRHPLRLRHVHPRLHVPAVEAAQRDRRWPGDPPLSPGDGNGVRRGQADHLPLPGRAGRLVRRRRLVDGDGRAHRHRAARAAHLRRPLPVLGLLPVRPGLHAAMARAAGLHRHGRASAALAGQSGRGRTAGRRDRQRRDGRHDRPGPGPDGRARDHAAALTVVRPVPAGPGPHRRPAAQDAARAPGLRRGAMEERPDRHRPVQLLPQAPGAGPGGAPEGRRQAAAGRLRHRDPLRPGLPALGPADVPGARRRLLRRDQIRPGRDRHRSHREVHRDRDPAALRHAPRRRRDRHRDRAEPAAAGRDRTDRRRASRSTCRSGSPTRA